MPDFGKGTPLAKISGVAYARNLADKKGSGAKHPRFGQPIFEEGGPSSKIFFKIISFAYNSSNIKAIDMKLGMEVESIDLHRFQPSDLKLICRFFRNPILLRWRVFTGFVAKSKRIVICL